MSKRRLPILQNNPYMLILLELAFSPNNSFGLAKKIGKDMLVMKWTRKEQLQ